VTARHCLAPACCLSCLAQARQGLSKIPEHLPLSSWDSVVSQGWAVVGEMAMSACQPRAAAGGCSQAERAKAPFIWSLNLDPAYLSAGTKVYNLCHGLNEALAKRQLSPLPEPSAKSAEAKARAPAACSPLGSVGDGDPVPDLSQGGPELFLTGTSSRRSPAACLCLWAARC